MKTSIRSASRAYAAGDAVAHGNAGVSELVVRGLTRRMRRRASGIHEDAYRDAALPCAHERVRVARVAHHPERDVDADSFLADVREDVRPAVLERRIAQTFLRRELRSGGRGCQRHQA